MLYRSLASNTWQAGPKVQPTLPPSFAGSLTLLPQASSPRYLL
jgi:hypothetical protein